LLRAGGRAALALLAGASLSAALPAASEGAGETRLRLLYSTDFLGALEPCG
jgi:hypothetical protein